MIRVFSKIRMRVRLREMDNLWYYLDMNSWGLFPPSYYYTHTKEDIEKDFKKTVTCLYGMIDSYKAKHNV